MDNMLDYYKTKCLELKEQGFDLYGVLELSIRKDKQNINHSLSLDVLSQVSDSKIVLDSTVKDMLRFFGE